MLYHLSGKAAAAAAAATTAKEGGRSVVGGERGWAVCGARQPKASEN